MRYRHYFYSLLSMLFSLLLVEAFLRTFTVFPIHSSFANRIYHEKLLYLMNSELNEIDPNGFRNSSVLKDSEYIAIGDSHTYGFNVQSKNSWPKQFEQIVGKEVYNMGLGGYGPIQYFWLLNQALELNPKHIVLALYPPNDLADVCDVISKSEHWRAWAESKNYNTSVCDDFKSRNFSDSDYEASIFKATAVGSFLMYFVNQTLQQYLKVFADKNAVTVEHNGQKVVFFSKRIAVLKSYMNIDNEYVALGFDVLKEMLVSVKEQLSSSQIKLSVLIIPSKERVFSSFVFKNEQESLGPYSAMLENENRIVRELSEFLTSLNIKHSDVEPVMVELVLNSKQKVYLSNGHPTLIGYRGYAEAAKTLTDRSELSPKK